MFRMKIKIRNVYPELKCKEDSIHETGIAFIYKKDSQFVFFFLSLDPISTNQKTIYIIITIYKKEKIEIVPFSNRQVL